MKQVSPFDSDLAKLKSILTKCDYSGDKDTLILIKENDASATLKEITIDISNGDWICFMPDKILNNKKCKKCQVSGISPLLKSGKEHDHHRICDAIIFNLNLKLRQLHVIFIELKSSGGGYEGQFKSARQFIKYLLGLLFEFNTISSFQQNNLKETFILFQLKLFLGKTTTTRKDLRSTQTFDSTVKKIPVSNGQKIPLSTILSHNII